jgi:hypothetical protein
MVMYKMYIIYHTIKLLDNFFFQIKLEKILLIQFIKFVLQSKLD